MKLIKEAVEDYWGKRCKEFDKDCWCCKAWKEFDKLDGNKLYKKLIKFLNKHSDMMGSERMEVAVKMNWKGIKNNIFSWQVCYFEIMANTRLGLKLLEKVNLK